MQRIESLHIDLSRISQLPYESEVKLDDAFFKALDQSEINGGNVDCRIVAKATAGDIFKVAISAKGQVVVACDRCLDDLTINIDTSDTFNIKDGDFDEADNPDMRYLKSDGRSMVYDLSWDVYEIIATTLPLQRCHAEGECNEDVAGRIAGIVGDDDANDNDIFDDDIDD